MSASPSKLKESGLTETTSVRPPKSNNQSPSKTSPTLSEILRDHARLFGKKPLVSPDRSTMSESDLGSTVVRRSNSISQEDDGGTESTGTDQAESSVSLSIDSSNLSPTVSQMIKEKNVSYRSTSISKRAFIQGNQTESILNDPEENQAVAESNGSVSPTVSEMMLNPWKEQSANKSISDGRIYNSKEGTKNRLSPNEARNVTVKLNQDSRYYHVVSTWGLTPVRSKFKKLHIYDTPQKKREYVSKELEEKIMKNRHEISPIIQQHLNGKLSSARKTKTARNIFGLSSKIRAFRKGKVKIPSFSQKGFCILHCFAFT